MDLKLHVPFFGSTYPREENHLVTQVPEDRADWWEETRPLPQGMWLTHVCGTSLPRAPMCTPVSVHLCGMHTCLGMPRCEECRLGAGSPSVHRRTCEGRHTAVGRGVRVLPGSERADMCTDAGSAGTSPRSQRIPTSCAAASPSLLAAACLRALAPAVASAWSPFACASLPLLLQFLARVSLLSEGDHDNRCAFANHPPPRPSAHFLSLFTLLSGFPS